MVGRDRRFPLAPGEGTDAVHSMPGYSYAVAEIRLSGSSHVGMGLTFTLGAGNEIVCRLIEEYGHCLVGRDFGEMMANFGAVSRDLADDPQLRWLGPHKGAVHLALSSVTNACFDLWAKLEDRPLWSLLLDLEPEQVVALIDLSYLEDALTHDQALALLTDAHASRGERMGVLKRGYPGYDTSVGWIAYSDEVLLENVTIALGRGFEAVKLKVGSPDGDRDVRRASLIRELIGDDKMVMLDANQAWSVPRALELCAAMADVRPLWIEEPTHPDDLLGHARIAREIAPLSVATGEHLSNRVDFKNFIAAEAMTYVQPDCVRLAGVGEFLAVSMLARKAGLPIMPHVGDMGQIHQHLVLFNHIALDHEALFLEYIPHLREHFVHPAIVEGGRYLTPQAPGCSSELIE